MKFCVRRLNFSWLFNLSRLKSNRRVALYETPFSNILLRRRILISQSDLRSQNALGFFFSEYFPLVLMSFSPGRMDDEIQAFALHVICFNREFGLCKSFSNLFQACIDCTLRSQIEVAPNSLLVRNRFSGQELYSTYIYLSDHLEPLQN